ncbi:MAG: transposase [Burkholderiales bacterium]|nr:transposase [Burkholderiales bacterium]
MPRPIRRDIPGYARHICIRAVNGMPCFLCDFDRYVFMKYLREAMERFGLELHAYVLMTNHVHLIATAREGGVVAKVMHYTCLQYARYFNRRYERTGPVFEGRYFASLVDSVSYLFVGMAYSELNPVRACMVDLPAVYPWSSHNQNLGSSGPLLITPHEEFLRLGPTTADRAAAWRDFVARGIEKTQLDRMRKRFRGSRPFGSEAFEKRTGSEEEGESPPTPILIAAR